ncbi:MAG TPA: hypothetical protein EYP59_10065 [Thiotrichaceae bacterium]|nr:hypothetical protein [Thiotrichaceae bacterium]
MITLPNAFAISAQKDAVPLLLDGLDTLKQQTIPSSDWNQIATVADERIVLLETDKQQLGGLQHTPLPQSRVGIAYLFQKTEADVRHQLQFHSSEEVALVYTGILANPQEARYELQALLGYHFEGQSDGEVVLRFLNRYLDLEIGISPLEATNLILSRLPGEFAIIALFAKPQALLLTASCQEGSLAIGVSKNRFYLSFDTKVLKKLCYPVMQLEKGSPILLH